MKGKVERMKRQVTARARLPRWARLTVASFTIVLLLTSAGGAFATSKVRVGDRISLFTPPTTYPAATAFHIWHGFLFTESDTSLGRHEFVLDVDGVERAADFMEVSRVDRRLISKVWVFNFPNGLTGVHNFEGHWITPDGTDTIPVTVDFTP